MVRIGGRPVLTPCLVGGVCVLLLAAGLFLLVMQPWDEQSTPAPLFVGRSQLVGTWSSPGDGTLVLKADGTAVATSVCGSGGGRGMGSFTATWRPRPGRISPVVQTPTGGIQVDAATYELDEGRSGSGRPVLWMYRDAPGDSGICTLSRQ